MSAAEAAGRAKKYVLSSLFALVFYVLAAPFYNKLYVILLPLGGGDENTLREALGGGDELSKRVAVPIVSVYMFNLFAVWFMSWWFEGLRGIKPLVEIVMKPFGMSSTLSMVYLLVLVLTKTVVGLHILAIIAVAFQGFGYGGAKKLIESSPTLQSTLKTRLKKIAFCHFVACVWTSMILMSCTILSVYPYLFWKQNATEEDENYGGLTGSPALNSIILGCLFGVAKSTMVTLFVFVAAPLCAKVLKIVRSGGGEEIDEEAGKEIVQWCELTILRFTKGVFSSLVLIPLICLHDYFGFLLALMSSFAISIAMGEVVLYWWVVKSGVKTSAVKKLNSSRIRFNSAAKKAGSFIVGRFLSSGQKGSSINSSSSVLPAGEEEGGEVKEEGNLKPDEENLPYEENLPDEEHKERVKSFSSVIQNLRNDDEWLRRIDLLREHMFCDQLNVISNGLIILVILLFPSHFKLVSHQSDKLDSLLFSESSYSITWFFARVGTLLLVEQVEYKMLFFRLRRVYRRFQGFRTIIISPLGYLQIASVPSLAMVVLFLLFPAFWL